MTVHVQTAEHGKKSYPHADAYNYDPEFGVLDLFSGDKLVGTYPHGAWVGVAIEIPEKKTEEIVDAELVPRVWYDIRDIPEGVDVVDNDGDALTWRAKYRDPDLTTYVGGRWDWANGYAPFTEVIS